MAEPEITVTLTGYEFTKGEIQAFLDELGHQDGMKANALIVVQHDCTIGPGAREYTLTASTAYREGGE